MPKHPSLAISLFVLFLTLSTAHAAQENVGVTGSVIARPVASFSIQVPISATAGQPFIVTITALDKDGILTTAVAQDVTLSTTNGGTISPILISKTEFAGDGFWTGQVILTRAGEARNIIAQSGTASGSASLIINPGPLDRLVVTPESVILFITDEFTFTAAAFDAYDNPIADLEFTWSVVNGGGTIDENGRFRAGTLKGQFIDTVKAVANQGSVEKSDAATVTVDDDRDGDGMPDAWEDQYTRCGLDKNVPDANDDPDNDGISNYEEYQEQGDPCVSAGPPPSFIDRVNETIQEIRQVILNNPVARTVVQKVIPILNPVLTFTATTTAISQLLTVTPALFSLNQIILYSSYLWSVILEGLGLKRRRRSWGVIYNAATKEPLPLVIVQLIEATTKKLVEQRVSDPYGRYGFLPKIGKYIIQATHPNFLFPSKFSPHGGDLRYTDLYHGEIINIDRDDVVIAYNIPLDPIEAKEGARGSRFPRLSFKRATLFLLLISVLLQGFATFVVEPSTKNILIFGAYLVILGVIFLGLNRRLRTWGAVYDVVTKKEVPGVQVFVSQEEDPRVSSRKVTDELGRFYTLLPKGTYRLIVQHPEYLFPAPAENVGYHGEALTLTPRSPLIHVDIPMVPQKPPPEADPSGQDTNGLESTDQASA